MITKPGMRGKILLNGVDAGNNERVQNRFLVAPDAFLPLETSTGADATKRRFLV